MDMEEENNRGEEQEPGGEEAAGGEGEANNSDNSSGGSPSNSSSNQMEDEDEGEGNETADNSDEMPYENWALRPADEPLPENVLHVMNLVFSNDMLVETILEKVILENDRATLRSCRLVNKQWMCAIAKLYRKMKLPQFIVNTNRENLVDPRPRPFFEQHTLLLEFIKPMVRPDRIEGFIPTFSLTLGAAYFRKTNYADFVNCLVQCGPSLVELYIRFPKNSAMSFLLPPSISLPNLNTLGVAFSGQSLLSHQFPLAYHHQTDYFPNNCSIHLVQTILNASSNLRRLHFQSCPNPMNPPDMENLYLPDSLRAISIDTPFRDFELFLRKSLPVLTELKINATIALYSEETIYDLLSKLAPTLRTVWLTGSAGTRRSLPIRLPKMEHVTKFVMFKPWEFEERNPPPIFEEMFPRLENLVFANQTEYSFSYMMSAMRSTTVTSFCVWLTSIRPHPPMMNFAPVGIPGEEQQHHHHHHHHHHNPLHIIRPLVPFEIAEPPERGEGAAGMIDPNFRGVLDLHRRVVPRVVGDPPAQNVEGFHMPPRRVVYPPAVQAQPIHYPVPAPERRRVPDDLNVIQIPGMAAAYQNEPAALQEQRQERYRMLAQRARLAWQYRNARERHQWPQGRENPDPRVGRQVPPVARRDIEYALRRQPQVVIERVRPPPAQQPEQPLPPQQAHRVIIRRVENGREAPIPPPPPPPDNALNERDAAAAHRERVWINRRFAMNNPNPIRAVYQHMLDRMEVDREEEDNALHRQPDEERNDVEVEEPRPDPPPRPPHVAAIRPLAVLAAEVAVNNNDQREERPRPAQQVDNADPPSPPMPAPEPEDEPVAGEPLVANQINEAVQEAFRVIREVEDDIPLEPPADEDEAEAENNERDQLAAAIGGARRRLRQQEARNLRDLRQLRQRILLEWAGRPPRPVPLPERPISMDKQKMQSINIAFPNLVKLTLNISGPETCGLKYIFEEMRSLQSLRIIVENSLWPIKWDALLTGIPHDFCDAIRHSSDLWDEVYLNENRASIRNLAKLEELMLLECIKMDETRDIHRQPLDERFVSDVAYQFGMLKMKELKHLTVTPGFSPSSAMLKKWYEEKGFKIKTKPRARLDVSYHEWQ